MTPRQKAACRFAMQSIGAFYADPQNEERFQEWRRKRAEIPATETWRATK